MAVLLVFSLIFSLTQATLTCNGVEYAVSGVTTIVPTDVCYTGVGTATASFSYWYQCDSNNKVVMNQYSNSECIGAALATTSVEETYSSIADSGTFQQACDLGACKYANVLTISGSVWSDCSDSSQAPTEFGTYTQKPFIQDHCMNIVNIYSEVWTCSTDGSSATHEYYDGIDCSGDPKTSVTVPTDEIECDSTNSGMGGSSGVAVVVNCGTAAFEGRFDETVAPVPAVTIPINECTDTELDCKAVEWSISGITIAYPLDVCFSLEMTANDETTAVSYWYRCDSGIPYIALFQQADCEGDSVDSALTAMYSLSEWVTVCCDLEPCQYVIQKTYSSVDLDCTDPDTKDLEAYTSIPNVEGYCNSVSDIASWQWSCVGGEARKDYYAGNGNCTGNSTFAMFDTSYEVDCGDIGTDTAASVGYGFECGTASFTGNGNNNNGGQPTSNPASTPCPSAGCVGQSKANNRYSFRAWVGGIIVFIAMLVF